LEQLEAREMLTVAQELAAAIAPYQPALTSALDAAAQLPLVGNQLNRLSEFATVLQNTAASIDSRTQNITTDGHYQVIVPLPSFSKTFSFNLGLDAFLKATAAGNVQAQIDPMLTIGFDVTGGTASLDVGQSRFDIGFGLALPGFQRTFSFNDLLFTKAVDAGTRFDGDLGFQFLAGGGLNPQFSGAANVLLDLSMSFVEPASSASFNPTFRTKLDMNWGFGANNQLAAPNISLVNVGLDAESFLHGFLGDVVKTVQKFTKPIQPFIDVFQTPVPILSAFDSSETIGTLMLKGAGTSPAQQESFKLMVHIINAVNSIDLSGSTGGAVIPFGTITVTGDPQHAGGFSFNTSQVTSGIGAILNNPALKTVENAIRTVGEYSGATSTSGFQFPLLENPGTVIAGILLGQPDTTLFSFSTGRQHFELAASPGVGIPGVLGLFLDAGIIFDANLTMGYDTAGLLAYAQNPGNVGKFLHGFYFDNSIDTSIPQVPNGPEIRKTGLYLNGLMALKADALLAHASGGLYANLKVELANTEATNHVHLDTMIGNLTSGGKVFQLGGKLYASADLSLGLELPIGPDITLFSFNLAYEELLNFDPAPAPTGVPLTVIDVIDQHTVLLDVSKMAVGSVITVQPFYDTAVTVGGSTFDADGIRIDYPGEIDLFVERKNDNTSNYYNLITLSGTAPDGVSINVIDPFRVFADEGAPDPAPTQTNSAVLLVGGKNVTYSFREAPDGSHPNVLLAGGYGSNSLTGGTMTFGNFIPAERIAQAKAHFANTSGFDGAGQGLINSQIDAAIAPANPAGIIGAKMTGNRGGLMMGGPGNNSFIATGTGVYEMVGGSWINSFNIGPSFSGGPASYQVDGGPYGQSSLVVRVPFDEMADFENGTVPDKYRPEFKALNIYSNAGLFTTAHGISKVLAIGSPGSTIVFGDTSNLDIDFKVKGSATLKFAGTDMPDQFNVTSVYDTYNLVGTHFSYKYSGRPVGQYGTDQKLASFLLMPYPGSSLPLDSAFPNVRVVPYDGRLTYINDYYGYGWVPPVYADTPYLYAVPYNGLFYYNYIAVNTGDPRTSVILPVVFIPGSDNVPSPYFRFDDPLYTVARTFGTNGRAQSISFEVGEVEHSSIVLDGRGGSDTYNLDVGLGSFLNITIDDTDATAQNSLNVNFLDQYLLPHKAKLTDNSLNLEYYTESWYAPTYGVHYLFQAVKYTPSIYFGDNTDITLTTAAQFKQTIVDRPRAPQSATVVANGLNPVGRFSIYSPVLTNDPNQVGTFFERYDAPVIGDVSHLPLLSINSATVVKPASGTIQAVFTVTLSFNPTEPVTVRVNTADGTATVADNDYQPITDLILTFNLGGPLSQSVTVLVYGNTRPEPDKTFLVNLSGPSGATILGGQGTGTIRSVVVAPIVALGPDTSMVQGTAFSRSGSFSAPGDGPWTATVDYGDGTGDAALPLNPDNTFLLSHTYSTPGTFVVTVVVGDGRGGVGRQSLSVTVTAVPSDSGPVPVPESPKPSILPSGFGAGRDAFVTELYRLHLGRDPEPKGHRYWARLLARGMKPMAVVRVIWSSREHRAAVRERHVPRVSLSRSYAQAIRAGNRAALAQASKRAGAR
jgi:hypothetical protein